jgi:hypothetical protein
MFACLVGLASKQDDLQIRHFEFDCENTCEKIQFRFSDKKYGFTKLKEQNEFEGVINISLFCDLE